jgi:predicted RNase H-like HicB family nuclease
MQLSYKILLHPEPEGGFTVTVPSLPGCITYGDNVEHAVAMAKDAVNVYLDELQDRAEPIFDDTNVIVYTLNIDGQ